MWHALAILMQIIGGAFMLLVVFILGVLLLELVDETLHPLEDVQS